MTPPSSNASENSANVASPANGVPAQASKWLDSESRTRVDLRPGFCTCGCGNRTPKHFLSGHNQRLRGSLVRAHQNSQRVLVQQAMGPEMLAAAAEVADLLGPEWLAWVAPDVEVQRAVGGSMLAVAADVFEAEWGDL